MVRTVFDHLNKYASQILQIAGDDIKPDQIVDIFNRHLALYKFVNESITLQRFKPLILLLTLLVCLINSI